MSHFIKKEKGSIIIYAMSILAILIAISISITSIFIPKLKISTDAINSVKALYAADSGLEWCLYVNRGNPNPPPQPVFGSGLDVDIYFDDNNPATCLAAESPLNHRSVGTYRGISRSFEAGYYNLIPIPTLSASPTSGLPGTAITLTYNNIENPTTTDWIGLFRVGDPDTDYLSLIYTSSCTNIPSGDVNSSGTCEFTDTSTLGSFNFRLFANDSDNKLATSGTVTIGAGAPSISTNNASNITQSGATLNGTVNPNAAATTAWFRYSATNPLGGCDDVFGTSTSPQNMGSGTTNTPIPGQSTGVLSPYTWYYFCAIAENTAGGPVFGAVLSFRTLAGAPTVATNDPTAVTQTTATLNSTITPNGDNATAWFRYSIGNPGTCNNNATWAGQPTTRVPAGGGTNIPGSNGATPDSRNISGLTPNTTYYYCALASNSIGTTPGTPVKSFTTQVLTPTLTIQSGPSLPAGCSAFPCNHVISSGPLYLTGTGSDYTITINAAQTVNIKGAAGGGGGGGGRRGGSTGTGGGGGGGGAVNIGGVNVNLATSTNYIARVGGSGTGGPGLNGSGTASAGTAGGLTRFRISGSTVFLELNGGGGGGGASSTPAGGLAGQAGTVSIGAGGTDGGSGGVGGLRNINGGSPSGATGGPGGGGGGGGAGNYNVSAGGAGGTGGPSIHQPAGGVGGSGQLNANGGTGSSPSGFGGTGGINTGGNCGCGGGGGGGGGILFNGFYYGGGGGGGGGGDSVSSPGAGSGGSGRGGIIVIQ